MKKSPLSPISMAKLFGTAALAIGASAVMPDYATAQTCGRVVGYGDSQAHRFALATGNPALAIDGKGLYTSALRDMVANIQPNDNIFFSIGSNDIGYVMGRGNNALAQYKNDLRERLQDIMARRPHSVAVMIPSTGDYPSLSPAQERFLNTTMAEAVRDVATDLGLGVIETANKRRDDGLHLTWSTMKSIGTNEFAHITGCPALKR